MQKHPVYQLSNEIVDELAATFPDIATEVGIAGYDDRWTDLSPDGAQQALHALRVMRRRVDALPAELAVHREKPPSVLRRCLRAELHLFVANACSAAPLSIVRSARRAVDSRQSKQRCHTLRPTPPP